MSFFDPNAYLDLEITESFEKRPLVPASDFPSEIQEIIPREWASKDKVNADGSPKKGIMYEIKHNVLIPEDVKAAVGLKPDFKLVLTDYVMVDRNEQGGLDSSPGANRQLRAYREALDMNKPGVAFRPREMAGRIVLIRLKHEEYPIGSGNFSEKINGVAAVK
ncbi:MAG: hypothetical protein LLG08_07130 [Actinomycetia bacterium]|nr:hypothetical protein [Actinomycetes bacterium]